MNNVQLVGRLTKDPELSYAQSGKAVCKFNIAVDRGKDDADFIPCAAFDKNAESIDRYFHKGKPIEILGSIRTGSYPNREGKKIFTQTVYVDRWGFVPQDKTERTETEYEGFSASGDRMPF